MQTEGFALMGLSLTYGLLVGNGGMDKNMEATVWGLGSSEAGNGNYYLGFGVEGMETTRLFGVQGLGLWGS